MKSKNADEAKYIPLIEHEHKWVETGRPEGGKICFSPSFSGRSNARSIAVFVGGKKSRLAGPAERCRRETNGLKLRSDETPKTAVNHTSRRQVSYGGTLELKLLHLLLLKCFGWMEVKRWISILSFLYCKSRTLLWISDLISEA